MPRRRLWIDLCGKISRAQPRQIRPRTSANSLAPFDRTFRRLMVDRVRMVKSAQRISVRPIESIDPSLHNIAAASPPP